MRKSKTITVSYKTVALERIEEKLDRVYQIIFQELEKLNKHNYESSGNNTN